MLPEDIERGIHTHTLMTGGKFLLNNEYVPEHVVFPKFFADVHQGLREAAPRLMGRRETYEDLIWLLLKCTISNKKAWEQDACLTEAISRPYHRFFLDLDLLFAKEFDTGKDWSVYIRRVCLSIGKAVMRCYPDALATCVGIFLHIRPLGRVCAYLMFGAKK